MNEEYENLPRQA